MSVYLRAIGSSRDILASKFVWLSVKEHETVWISIQTSPGWLGCSLLEFVSFVRSNPFKNKCHVIDFYYPAPARAFKSDILLLIRLPKANNSTQLNSACERDRDMIFVSWKQVPISEIQYLFTERLLSTNTH